MTRTEIDALGWRKAKASADTNCVEHATDGSLHYVRSSRDPHGPVLTFSSGEWAAFVTGVSEGEFPA